MCQKQKPRVISSGHETSNIKASQQGPYPNSTYRTKTMGEQFTKTHDFKTIIGYELCQSDYVADPYCFVYENIQPMTIPL